MKHTIKSKTFYFQDFWKGLRASDVRNNDRNFNVGDLLIIEEVKPQHAAQGDLCSSEEEKTGRVIVTKLIAVDAMLEGLKPGYCFLTWGKIRKFK